MERTTDFTTLQGHVLALYVLEVVDVHVGQGVVVCTVWRTNRCILKMYNVYISQEFAMAWFT